MLSVNDEIVSMQTACPKAARDARESFTRLRRSLMRIGLRTQPVGGGVTVPDQADERRRSWSTVTQGRPPGIAPPWILLAKSGQFWQEGGLFLFGA